MKKLTDDQLARMRNVDYQRMQRRESRKNRKAKEARDQLTWYDENPDHPKTLAFRQAKLNAVIAKYAIDSFDADKRAERLEKRLNVSLENFIACFKIDHNHPAGISPVNRLAHVESVVGNAGPRLPEWKAYAMGKGMMAQYVASRLRNTPETPQERRNAIPAHLPRIRFMIQRKHSHDRVEGVEWKNFGIFETAGGYVAACRLDTGEVFESSQTYQSLINKLKRKRK